MAVSDPISDFLTRIRNAGQAQHRYVDIPWSKMKESIANILKENGFVDNVMVRKDNDCRGTIRVFLKYRENRQPLINGLKRVSKPGLRKFIGYQDIPYFYGGYGISILSTSRGVMAGKTANDQKVGGELLCLVW